MRVKRFFLFAVIMLAAAASAAGLRALAATTTVVTEDDIARQAEDTPPTRSWVLYTRNAGNGQFHVGPGAPPLGVGSFETVTPTGADKAYLFNFDHVGTALADIDAISYSTYRAASAADDDNQLPALNIQVDINGGTLNPGEFTTLVFEPIYNPQQTIQDDAWQTWDAYAGGNAIWWSSKPIPGVCAFSCYVTWNSIVAANPNATIVGGFGINQGSGNPGLKASTDALTIGYNGDSVTYNFEPYRVAASKDDCKTGSWQSVKRANGSAFKNQGQCIQYVNTGK